MSILIAAFATVIVLQDLVSHSNGEKDAFLYDVFPPDFQWGYASSSYQVDLTN